MCLHLYLIYTFAMKHSFQGPSLLRTFGHLLDGDRHILHAVAQVIDNSRVEQHRFNDLLKDAKEKLLVTDQALMEQREETRSIKEGASKVEEAFEKTKKTVAGLEAAKYELEQCVVTKNDLLKTLKAKVATLTDSNIKLMEEVCRFKEREEFFEKESNNREALLKVEMEGKEAKFQAELEERKDAEEKLQKSFEVEYERREIQYEATNRLQGEDLSRRTRDYNNDLALQVGKQEQLTEELGVKERQVLFEVNLNDTKDMIVENIEEEHEKMDTRQLKLLQSVFSSVEKETKKSELIERQRRKALAIQSSGLQKIMKGLKKNPTLDRLKADYHSTVSLDSSLSKISGADGCATLDSFLSQLDRAEAELTPLARKNRNRRMKTSAKKAKAKGELVDDYDQMVVDVDPLMVHFNDDLSI